MTVAVVTALLLPRTRCLLPSSSTACQVGAGVRRLHLLLCLRYCVSGEKLVAAFAGVGENPHTPNPT